MTNANSLISPQEAEAAFYDAFQRADLEAMMRVWADDQDIVCIHPGGERLEGVRAVVESWRQIFDADSRLQFELTDARQVQDGRLAVRYVKENIYVDATLRGVMLATNVYRRSDGEWRMILHHASPQPHHEPEPGGSLH